MAKIREITIYVDDGMRASPSTRAAGFDGEHMATEIVFDLPEELQQESLSYVIELENAAGVCPPVAISACPVKTLLPKGVMQEGDLYVQLTVLQGGRVVTKTSMVRLTVSPSLTANPEVENQWEGLLYDQLSKFEKAWTAARNLPFIGDNYNWYLYNIDAEKYVDSGKSAKGDKGDKGDPGEGGGGAVTALGNKVYFERNCENWSEDIRIYFFNKDNDRAKTEAWRWEHSPSMWVNEAGFYEYPIVQEYDYVMFWCEKTGDGEYPYRTSGLYIPPKSLYQNLLYIQSPIGYDGVWAEYTTQEYFVFLQVPHLMNPREGKSFTSKATIKYKKDEASEYITSLMDKMTHIKAGEGDLTNFYYYFRLPKTAANISFCPEYSNGISIWSDEYELEKICYNSPVIYASLDMLTSTDLKFEGIFDGMRDPYFIRHWGFNKVSPYLEVTKTEGITEITIHDKYGIQNVSVMDGSDGKDGTNGLDGKDGTNGTNGKDGINGTDGYSPSARVEKTDVGAKITITDKEGETTAEVKTLSQDEIQRMIDNTVASAISEALEGDY